jgi:hypothetical protein
MRSFKVVVNAAPVLNLPKVSYEYEGNDFFGHFSAAKACVEGHFPGYSIIPGGLPYPGGFRFTAHSEEYAFHLYVSERYYDEVYEEDL